MRDEIEYLVTALDFHIRAGRSPHAAWAEALEDYAFVHHPPDDEEKDLRLPISRAAERALYHITKEEPLPEPIRKFVYHEQLTARQFVITDAVKALATGGNELAAIKLIRGAFAGEDLIFCSVATAKEILGSIMARR